MNEACAFLCVWWMSSLTHSDKKNMCTLFGNSCVFISKYSNCPVHKDASQLANITLSHVSSCCRKSPPVGQSTAKIKNRRTNNRAIVWANRTEPSEPHRIHRETGPAGPLAKRTDTVLCCERGRAVCRMRATRISDSICFYQHSTADPLRSVWSLWRPFRFGVLVYCYMNVKNA